MSIEHTSRTRRRHGLLDGRARGRLLDDERRLAPGVDQLRAPERLPGDELRRGEGCDRGDRENPGRALPGRRRAARGRRARPRRARPERRRRPDGGGRHLRHRSAPGQGRVAAADADGARPRRRRRRRARGRRRRSLFGRATRSCSRGRRRAAIARTARAAAPPPACRSTARSGTGRSSTARPGCRSATRPSIAARRRARGQSESSSRRRSHCRRAARCRCGDAALLGCAALTGVGAVLFAARAEPGGVVLVIGAGGVGQFVVQGARIAGAEAIVVVDPVESRREQALRLGATHAVHPDDLKEALRGDRAGGRRLRLRRRRLPGDERDGVALHPQRRHHRDGRAAADRAAARPRPGRVPPPREVPHGDDVRLRGSRGRAADPARARRSRPARAGATARARSFPLDGSTTRCRRASSCRRAACWSSREPGRRLQPDPG